MDFAVLASSSVLSAFPALANGNNRADCFIGDWSTTYGPMTLI